MRVVFMGSPPFAVPVFGKLCASEHAVIALVTPPDKPKGRGRRVEQSPLVELAHARGVQVLQPASARDPSFVDALRELAPDVLLVASYGEILKREVLELAPRGALNVHASLLPRHRGASPIQAAILAGDRETGVTIQRMAQKLDEGDILLAEKTPIGAHETAGELLERLAQLGADAAVRALDLIQRGDARFTPQDATHATYAKKIKKEDGRIDWSQSAETISRIVRALTPWPGARTNEPGGTEIVLLDVRVHDSRSSDAGASDARASNVSPSNASPNDARPTHASPSDAQSSDAGSSDAHRDASPSTIGTILPSKNVLLVATGSGKLEIRALKPAGKDRMDGASWLRGMRLEPGARFGS